MNSYKVSGKVDAIADPGHLPARRPTGRRRDSRNLTLKHEGTKNRNMKFKLFSKRQER
jgi:hypothetical protein